ncbi:MAG: CbiQ family ECF transporter T component [Archaeoglobaceae archaeon]|nr:CbiQ family ECF transporter T component [Archaeoglobaceae archaeon]MDW8128151.1 CbiQ family ECF transporter T component [Archaeoglobaceae archaeon]
MSESLESVQVRSRKLIDGPIKVWLVIVALPLILIDLHVQLIALILFSALSLHASKYFLKLITVPLSFIILGVVVIMFTIDGKEIASFYFLKITDKSLETAINTLLRSFSAISALSYLVLTTTLPEFLSAIRIKGFLKEIMLLGYRAIQVLIEEFETLRISADARLGFSGIKKATKTTSMLSYILFLRAFEKVEKFERAKEARCYSGNFPILKFENKNSVFAISLLALLALGLLV